MMVLCLRQEKPLIMHLQPVFNNARAFVNGSSERLFDNGLTLPSGSVLEDSDIDRVIETTRAALGQRLMT